jgi:PiT family inorganic phosphate transporter
MLLLVLRAIVRNPKLYKAPAADERPPWWIRGALITTCTAVSFAHGGNDGQKGMGLIMLILIGAAPAAFALNRAMPERDVPAVIRSFEDAGSAFAATAGTAAPPSLDEARAAVGDAVRTKKIDSPETSAALAALSADVAQRVSSYGSLTKVPVEGAAQLRSDMYTISEAAGLALKSSAPAPTEAESAAYKELQTQVKASTRYIPDWVKIAVAFALGLGTMAGWRRIVITVGERIGKRHMTYAQGASAEFVAASAILTAQHFGLPVSTTHLVSSGVAGTMAANGSGLQWSTIGAIASAWLLTLPAVVTLSGVFYYLFMKVVG